MTGRAKPQTPYDPITLEILWSRLISIADESAAALLRTSFDTAIVNCDSTPA